MAEPLRTIRLTIPGEPAAQGRARATIRAGHAAVYTPKADRGWRSMARNFMWDALAGGGPMTGPVELTMDAVFTCPRSRWRKKTPRPREHHVKRPDLDNVLKAVKDAATGVLWVDDRQVVRVMASKIQGAQGEPARIGLTIAEVG